MSKDLNFDGWWEGTAEYTCDNCGNSEYFPFTDEDEAKDSKTHRKALREEYGWITTKVNGYLKDFCCESCRNQYIRKNTI